MRVDPAQSDRLPVSLPLLVVVLSLAGMASSARAEAEPDLVPADLEWDLGDN